MLIKLNSLVICILLCYGNSSISCNYNTCENTCYCVFFAEKHNSKMSDDELEGKDSLDEVDSQIVSYLKVCARYLNF